MESGSSRSPERRMSGSTTRFLMLLTAAPSLLLRLSPFFPHRRRRHRFAPSPFLLASPRLLHSPASSFSTPSFPSPPPEHHYHHPWPEWSSLLGHLSSSAAGHLDISGVQLSVPGLPEDAASTCVSFARRRPDILAMLPRRDIEVVVEKGEPFLFDGRAESVQRMKLFLTNNVLDGDDREETAVDLMKYLLSYVSNAVASSERSSDHDIQLVELSVRNLLQKMSQLDDQYNDGRQVNQLGSVQNRVLDGYQHTARPLGQNAELRQGDWTCHRCSFMNFNRNVKCLQCKEARPKRQLTGGEWECPQCEFYNYRRNTVCLRCDCKQPAVALPVTTDVGSGEGYQENLNNPNRADHASDVSGATANEDFPEIMPLRKGVNRFVVSRRKSTLETDGQHQRNQNNWGSSESYGHQNTNGEKAVGQKLTDTFGNKIFGFDNLTSRRKYAGTKNRSEDFGANKFDNMEIDEQKPLPLEKERAGKSDQWFERVAELHNVTDTSSGISDGDFSEIMPMPEGESRFVVSKKKEDRSLTSPSYKRQMAMDPSTTTNHVPFVPFPPNYFARKDNQQQGAKTICQSSNAALAENVNRTTASPMANVPGSKNQESGTENRHFRAPGRNSIDVKTNSSYEEPISKHLAQNAENSGQSASGSWRSQHSIPGYMGGRLNCGGESEYSSNTTTSIGKTSQPSEDANITSRSTSKSLEGSQVKEPDPLDMSEEAKAERWFRRVAQIKDISELSQIPDEDFPSIMPMRKGVNRFVVSKRKTPLERRLASNQYRRNLPTVSTDPANESDSS